MVHKMHFVIIYLILLIIKICLNHSNLHILFKKKTKLLKDIELHYIILIT